MNKITRSISAASLLLGIFVFFSLSARAGTLSVTNGSFTDLSSNTVTGGAWYGGVPAGWSSDAPASSFTVLTGGTNYANLQTLGPASPSFTPLRQNVGTVDLTSDVTLTFTLNTLSGTSTLGSAIYNLALTPYTSALATYSSGSISSPSTVSYTARGVAPGTALYIAFWNASSSAGISGVSILDSATTYTWNGGVSGVWTNGGGGWLDNFANTATNYSNARPVVAQFTNASAGTNVTVASDGVTVGAVEVSGANHTISGGTITMTNTTWTVASSRSAIVGSTLAGTTGLAKSGSGQLVLSGSNSYSGTTTISNGTLRIGNSGTTGSYSGDTVVASGGTLAFSRTDAYTHGGAISGAGAVTKVDAGAVTLTASNSYSGVTTLFAGTLVADNSNALGTGNITFSSGGGNTGTIRYTAASAGTDWGARFKNSTGTMRLDTDGNNVALAGAIDSSNTQGLVKSGSGSLTLSGANAYTGTTSVTAGVLELASAGGAAAGGASALSVGTGATLLLSQSNQVNDAATVTLSGGTIRRASGVSEVFGNLTLSSGSFLDYDTGATGTLRFGTYAPANLLTVQNFAQGNVLRFGTDVGSFLPTGGALTNSFFSFNNAFAYDSSTFTITAIPEPSTYVVAVGLLGLMLWPARRYFVRGSLPQSSPATSPAAR